MRSEKPLDYAVFQLSPQRSRCELLVSSDGKTEKLASGLVKPFVAHLKVVEEQFALETQLIKLEIDKHRKSESWFTKGTLERFVRFVSTPDVLELFNTYDSEMSQLEAALNIYSQGTGDRLSGSLGGDGMGTMAVGDATKKELLRAIDVRLLALKQDLTTACSRAASAGFNSQSVCELQLFSDQFGAHRLNEACAKFLSLCQKRPELCNSLNTRVDDCTVRSSYSSDMSIDDSPEHLCRPHFHSQNGQQGPQDVCEASESPVMESPSTADTAARFNEEKKEGSDVTGSSSQTSQFSRRLSVQDRINIFENKQKQSSGSRSGSGRNTIVGKSTELRKQSPNAATNTAPAVVEKAVLRRWSGSSDMSIDLGNDRTESLNSPAASQAKPDTFLGVPKDLKDHPDSQTCLEDSSGNGGEVVMKLSANQNFQADGETQARDGAACTDIFKQALHQNQFKPSVANRDLSVLTDNGSSQDKATFLSSSQESSRFIDPLASEAQFTIFSGHKQALSGIFSNKSEEVGHTHSRPSTRLTVHSPQFHSQTHAVLSEGGHGGKEVSEDHWRKAENSQGRRDLGSSEKDPENFDNEGEDLGESTSKFQGQRLGPQRAKKSHVRIESSNNVADIHKNMGLSSTEAEELNQRGRQVKENQGFNDKLKIKANELEKLFAEHRLRASDDPLISNQRSTLNDIVTDPSAFSQSRKPEAESIGYSSPVATLNPGSGRKLKDSEDYGVALKNVSELGFSNDSRGKLYEKYRRKRDAKLKEEWGSKGTEKEAKMKAMYDSLERSSAEMKAKFAGSAEKFRKKEQQATDNLGSGEDEDPSSELSDQKLCEQDSLFSESKKLTPNKKFSSMTPYISSRLFVRGANSAPVRQRGQLESPSAQSVSNFTNLRKENTKPASVTGEKLRPLKKNPPDLNDVSALTPNDVLTPSKSMTSQRFEKRKNRNAELKPFIWKGNGIGPGSGFANLPDSTSPETSKLEDGMLESHIRADHCIDAGSEDEEEFDTLVVEDEDAVGSVSDMNITPVPVQDSPDDSPLLWNSSLQCSFLYPQSLDISVPATSAMGSAATWNSHPLTQTEAEDARMRKKWGGAHKPVVNSSQNQSRKDVTKGFKRLLKFGRKNGGTELVDWISATTSEGDDDTEDGRDPGNQSAEDLRKLRMVPSEDVFNDSEVFDEHVRALGRPIPAPPASLKLREDHPSGNSLKASRSFFSLSTFRSRGTDSRTR